MKPAVAAMTLLLFVATSVLDRAGLLPHRPEVVVGLAVAGLRGRLGRFSDHDFGAQAARKLISQTVKESAPDRGEFSTRPVHRNAVHAHRTTENRGRRGWR